MTAHQKPRVYLAGSHVFRPNARAIGEMLKALCASCGLEGLYPLDNDVPVGTPDAAGRIFSANLAMIRSAAALVADITPFRGPHCDPGTAFEIGYALHAGLPVFAYTRSNLMLAQRIACDRVDDTLRDADGKLVEDFGLAENLMIACAVTSLHTTVPAAIAAAAKHLLG